MLFIYDPTDHYWIVAGDVSRVYSSKRGDYVPVSDATYQAWLSSGLRQPTPIDTEENLGSVLGDVLVRPLHAGILDAYQDSQAKRLTLQLVAKAVLWCVNQIRTQNNQSTLNAQQFRQFLKGLM